MPRAYGQLRHDIWSDDDWLNLTVPAQHLYMTLLGNPKLNYCGVTDWRPGKLAISAAENPIQATVLAAQELSYAYFLVIDEQTEEVLLRSYLRHDPILSNPRLSVTMANDYGVIGSRKIRSVLVHELKRLKAERPEWAAWDKPQVQTVLRQTAANPRELDTDLLDAAHRYLPNVVTPLKAFLPSGLPNDLPSGLPGALPSALPSEFLNSDKRLPMPYNKERVTGNIEQGTSTSTDSGNFAQSYPQPPVAPNFDTDNDARLRFIS